MRAVGALGLVGCLWLGGAASAPTVACADTDANTNTVFVVRRGWHIDVGFAVDELAEPLRVIAGEFPGARYVLFGFGDRRYLMARHRGVPLLLMALFPGPGLILGTGLTVAPEVAFGRSQVIALKVPRDGALRAQALIWQTLTDAEEAVLLLRDAAARGPVGIPGPYQGSAFFDSRDRYSAAHTCNTWAAEVVAQAGVPVASGELVFAGQVWRRLQRISPQQPLPRSGAGSRLRHANRPNSPC